MRWRRLAWPTSRCRLRHAECGAPYRVSDAVEIMVEHVGFLGRGAIEATVRRPSFARTWAEHDRVAAAEVAALLGGATIAIINKKQLPGGMLAPLRRRRSGAVSANG